jgi:hypothetical protein
LYASTQKDRKYNSSLLRIVFATLGCKVTIIILRYARENAFLSEKTQIFVEEGYLTNPNYDYNAV